MFSIQRNLLKQTETCSEADFWGCFSDSRIIRAIKKIREAEAVINDETKTEYDRNLAKKAKASLKKGLPGMLFQATFAVTKSSKGYEGRWRKQSAAILNGLFMCDFDHITNPRELFDEWGGAKRMEELGVMLAYITPSGRGIKLVAKAKEELNLIENARHLASILCNETDEACKDASRLSFVSGKDDILYINKEIFTYDNPRFERKWGDNYRSGDLSGSLFSSNSTKDDTTVSVDNCDSNGQDSTKNVNSSNEIVAQAQNSILKDYELYKNLNFKEVPYEEIVRKYTELRGGDPALGTRHTWLLSMARNFRYICDFNPELLYQVLIMSKAGSDKLREGCEKELRDIVDSNIRQPAYDGYPKYIRLACEGCGIDLSTNKTGLPLEKIDIDYGYWWNRLKPLLDGGYKEACNDIDDANKLGGVLSAGAMFGTYLTKCFWQHYDGNPYRLSYMVYVIGDPASGKSFVIRQDQAIMKLLREQDQAGREWEAKVKEENEKRSQSSKEAKKEALPIVHPVIRYVPSSISNAVFYRRSMDAVATVDGKEMHLHLYTMESELATALRAQVGSWAGKHDMELKSFQNEYAGVDFANQQSVNGIIQVNWNQVVTSTMDGVKQKLAKGNINDGFITRLALWVMPSNHFQMIEKVDGKVKKDTSALEKWGYILQNFEGEIKVPKLVDFCYEWCSHQCEIAALEDDYLIDYFRKRVPIYMMRYTIPRIVMREHEKFAKTGKWNVNKSDLDFAQLIGDYLMYIQIYLFGAKLETAKDKMLEDNAPRLRKSNFQAFYESLADTFTLQEFSVNYKNEQVAKVALARLIRIGIIQKLNNSNYKKLMDSLEVTTYKTKR